MLYSFILGILTVFIRFLLISATLGNRQKESSSGNSAGVHKIGRFIVYDAISVITQNVFYGFARPSELGERVEGIVSPIFWQG